MKELIASLLLLALLTGALLNIGYLRGFTAELTDELEESRKAAQTGDWEKAEKTLRSAIESWNASDRYTHIFIRHSEIDSATDALYELLSDVISQDMESAGGSYEKAQSHLSSIYTMERVTLGSVL